MTKQRNNISCISEKKFSHKVTPGDDYQYPIKGVGESNHKLNSGNPLKMKDVLYVPSLKKNLLSISAIDKKGDAGSSLTHQVSQRRERGKRTAGQHQHIHFLSYFEDRCTTI